MTTPNSFHKRVHDGHAETAQCSLVQCLMQQVFFCSLICVPFFRNENVYTHSNYAKTVSPERKRSQDFGKQFNSTLDEDDLFDFHSNAYKIKTCLAREFEYIATNTIETVMSRITN